MGDKASSLNVRDNILKVTTKDSRLARFEFNKLVVFDDRNVYGLPLIKEKKVGKSRVLDWFDVRSGMEHEHDFLRPKMSSSEKLFFIPPTDLEIKRQEELEKDLVRFHI